MGIIKAENLAIGYWKNRRENKIVHDRLSFSLREGELTCLLGQNGVGKSTLLRTISGSQPVLGGELLLYGRPLASYRKQEIARIFGLVLTDRTMAGGLNVFDTVALGRYPYTGFFGRLHDDDHAVVRWSLEMVGISDKAGAYVSELSDGVRQKVMIAKALAQECPVLLLDEPTAFLDVASRIEIMNLLRELAVTQRKTILISTHDMEQAFQLSDRLWLLSDENAMQCGVTEDLVFSEDIGRFFSRDKIVFDKMSGNFHAGEVAGQKVHIRAGGELMYWTKNAFLRHGYKISTDASGAKYRITVTSPADIQMQTPQGELELHSFSQLNDFLRSPEAR